MKKYFLSLLIISLTINISYAKNSINNETNKVNNKYEILDSQINNFITSKNAILMDYNTGDILYQKNMDEIIAPSSMTKIMTAYVIFDMLENKEININDKFRVSVRAWRQTGTRMFLEPEWKINVDELLKGLLIISGNDAAITLAEGSCGNIENFVIKMNETAKILGMNNTNFINPNGLYEKTHYTTVHDFAILTRALIKKHYKYYKKYFSQKEFTFNNITQKNKNLLLTEYQGVDGVKTGFTDQGKYSITASVERNGKRFIAVIGNAEGERIRLTQCKRLFDYAFRQYKYIDLFKKNDTVGDVGIFFGINNKVSVYTKNDIIYSTRKSRINDLKINLVYDKYIFAPIKKDDKIAKLRIIDGNIVTDYDLYSSEDINIITKFKKFRIMFRIYASRIFRFW